MYNIKQTHFYEAYNLWEGFWQEAELVLLIYWKFLSMSFNHIIWKFSFLFKFPFFLMLIASDQFVNLLQCPDRRVNPIPHRHLPEPSSYGYINRPGLRPESQAVGSYPAHSSYYGDSSTQPSLWGPMPSPSGRHAAPSPGSLSIHPSNLGNHPIQPAAQYQANS